MDEDFSVLDLNPSKLAPAVRGARESLGWTIAELARQAHVEFYSVSRIEEEEDPGILTSLVVAETAKLITFRGLGPDPDTLEFAELLASKPDVAAGRFQTVFDRYFAPEPEDVSPQNVFLYYNSTKTRATQTIVDAIPTSSVLTLSRGHFLTPLLRDLGNISKGVISSTKPSERAALFDKSDPLFWNHIATGRAVNVSARRLVKSVTSVCDVLRNQRKDSKVPLHPDIFLNLARDAFVNHLLLDRCYKSALKFSGKNAMPDFWELIFDYVRMKRIIYLDETRNLRRAPRKKRKVK